MSPIYQGNWNSDLEIQVSKKKDMAEAGIRIDQKEQGRLEELNVC